MTQSLRKKFAFPVATLLVNIVGRYAKVPAEYLWKYYEMFILVSLAPLTGSGLLICFLAVSYILLQVYLYRHFRDLFTSDVMPDILVTVEELFINVSWNYKSRNDFKSIFMYCLSIPFSVLSENYINCCKSTKFCDHCKFIPQIVTSKLYQL